MCIEDVIVSLENYARTICSDMMLILQRQVIPYKFRAFREFKYTIWCIDKLQDKRYPLYILNHTDKVISQEDEDKIKKNLERQIITDLFKYVGEGKFKLKLNEYHDLDESISDTNN